MPQQLTSKEWAEIGARASLNNVKDVREDGQDFFIIRLNGTRTKGYCRVEEKFIWVQFSSATMHFAKDNLFTLLP